MASRKNTGNKDLGRAGYELLCVALPGLLSWPGRCQKGQAMPRRSVLLDAGRSKALTCAVQTAASLWVTE